MYCYGNETHFISSFPQERLKDRDQESRIDNLDHDQERWKTEVDNLTQALTKEESQLDEIRSSLRRK
jgi:hypothetical protein